jgi:hypothetical protein
MSHSKVLDIIVRIMSILVGLTVVGCAVYRFTLTLDASNVILALYLMYVCDNDDDDDDDDDDDVLWLLGEDSLAL